MVYVATGAEYTLAHPADLRDQGKYISILPRREKHVKPVPAAQPAPPCRNAWQYRAMPAAASMPGSPSQSYF